MKAVWEVKKNKPQTLQSLQGFYTFGLPQVFLCALLYPALHLVVQKSFPAPLTSPNLC